MDSYNNVINLKHIGFIMDGNGRWAKSRNKERSYGHKKGAEVLASLAEVCHEKGIQVVSLYAFSTENWSRPKAEIDEIMNLFEDFLVKYTKKLVKNKIRLLISGDASKLSPTLQELCKTAMQQTEQFKLPVINLAVNYGGRQELVMAVNRLINSGKTDISEEDISNNLYTKGLPDLDLVIRTSGEQRLSNFMLYQSAYAELYFTDVLWPDFNKEQLEIALQWYGNRHRRFGGV